MAQTRDKMFYEAFVQHADRCVEAAKLLEKMFAGLNSTTPPPFRSDAKDVAPPDIKTLAQQVRDVEHAGDKITHDAIAALHTIWITPLDRDEIHALMSRLDDVLDYIEAASERIVLFDLQQATGESRRLAEALVKTTEAVRRAVGLLPNMKNREELLKACVEINSMENEADAIYREAIARLFREERDPMLVMKWKDIYETLEGATDRAEDVANIIEGIVLELA